MTPKDLAWLWTISGPVCSHERGLKEKPSSIRLKRRLAFVWKGMELTDSLRPFMRPQPGSRLHRSLIQDPEMLGAVLWPYICATWSADVRLGMIASHFDAMDALGPTIDRALGSAPPLLRLDQTYPNLQVIVDQPRWLFREGLLAINLFLAESRVYSLSFSFALENGERIAYVGGIQGSHADGMLDQYKELTKALLGMRPRDFLVELFRCFCRCLDIATVYGVDDQHRHHRNVYFDSAMLSKLFLNYDDVWSERGGVKEDNGFYRLSSTAPAKPLDEVPSKKRAMYRRRYALLDAVEQQIRDHLKG